MLVTTTTTTTIEIGSQGAYRGITQYSSGVLTSPVLPLALSLSVSPVLCIPLHLHTCAALSSTVWCVPTQYCILDEMSAPPTHQLIDQYMWRMMGAYRFLRSYLPCKRINTTQLYTSFNTAAQHIHTDTTAPNPQSDKQPWIILGLGNGNEYIHTRHNIGQDCINQLSIQLTNTSLYNCHNTIRSLPDNQYITPNNTLVHNNKCVYVVQCVGDVLCYIVHTDTYMNNSGTGLRKLIKHISSIHNIPQLQLVRQLIVVYDELDLSLGTLRLSHKHTRTSHNGIADIQKCVHAIKQSYRNYTNSTDYNNNSNLLLNNEFIRLRVGIGDECSGEDMIHYVLNQFTPTQQAIVDTTIKRVCSCIIHLVQYNDINKSMTLYNKTYQQFYDIDNIDTVEQMRQRQARRMKYEQYRAEQRKSIENNQSGTNI